jgi:hypothetical protein
MNRSAGSAFIVSAGHVALVPAPALAQFVYPPPYPYGYFHAGPESDLRLVVTPREAMVYVDGYLAGTVDEFDGVFQRLHVMPGEHEITLHLPGYRTISRRLYLSPNGSRKMTETMEKLADGQVSEPPPTPPEPKADTDGATPSRGQYPFPEGRPGPPRREPPQRESAASPPDSSSRAGSLIVRVQPSGTDVSIDGEPWQGPSGDARLVVQVSEGRHRIEVKKEGYAPFSSDVEVMAGESLAVNVSLVRESR